MVLTAQELIARAAKGKPACDRFEIDINYNLHFCIHCECPESAHAIRALLARVAELEGTR